MGAVLVTAALFAVFAWRDRQQTIDDATVVTANVAALLGEHANRLFETSDFLLIQAMGLAGPADQPIANTLETWQALAAMVSRFPYVTGFWLGDDQGDAVLSSHSFPAPPLNAADRDYFAAARDDRADPYITVIISRLTGQRMIVLSRRLDGPAGEFRGFATVTIDAQHLIDFYGGVQIGYDMTVLLARSDRTVLIREPALPDDQLAQLDQATRFQPGTGVRAGQFRGVSPLDGIERLVAFQRIGNYDAYVLTSIPAAQVEAAWRDRLWGYSYYGMPALAAILGLGWLAFQRARREQAAKAELERRVRDSTAELRRALADKDMLFRDMHHRVKNNMQVVSSLLSLQAMRLDGPARAGLEASLRRIQTMGMVHELLYRSGQPAQIEFATYLRQLCGHLADAYATSDRVRITVEASECLLGLDVATPLALIVTELVTNALKYAFPGERAGTIRVILRGGKTLERLVVSDDGIGLPHRPDEEIRDDRQAAPGRSGGLGFPLVRGLAGQVGATVSIDCIGGTTVTLVMASKCEEPDAAAA